MTLFFALCAGASVFLGVCAITGTPVPFRLPARIRRRHGADWFAHAQVSPWQFQAVSVASGAVVATVAWAISESWIVGLVPGLVAVGAPRMWWQHRAQRRQTEVVEAWPDAIRHLLSSLESRASIHAGLVELARSGPAPFRVAFARYPLLARTVGTTGALALIREQLADPVSDLAVEVLIVAAAQGTDEALAILREMDDEIVVDLRTAAEVRAEQYEPRLVARIAAAFPWAMLVLLCATVGVVRQFYASGAAIVPIAIAALIDLAGIAVVRRLVREAAEPRVLGGRM